MQRHDRLNVTKRIAAHTTRAYLFQYRRDFKNRKHFCIWCIKCCNISHAIILTIFFSFLYSFYSRNLPFRSNSLHCCLFQYSIYNVRVLDTHGLVALSYENKCMHSITSVSVAIGICTRFSPASQIM